MLKKKVFDLMEKHPKFANAASTLIISAAETAALCPVFGSGLSASADFDSTAIDTAVESLVDSAGTSFSNGVKQVTPLLAGVITFNVIVRLVRRFVKG